MVVISLVPLQQHVDGYVILLHIQNAFPFLF